MWGTIEMQRFQCFTSTSGLQSPGKAVQCQITVSKAKNSEYEFGRYSVGRIILGV
uniref:Uncharacterized protein n=1 Tax=Anguilla anguilla TaxID=7936 RepID=A0A0E9VRE5_ANGAN